MTIDDGLYQFATPGQAAYMDAYRTHGSFSKAARALGIHQRTLERSIETVRRKAAKMGYSPAHDMTHTVPEGFRVKGTTTLYDSDGVLRAQWVKTCTDWEAKRQDILTAVETIWSGKPRKPTKAPQRAAGDLLTVYPIGDPHIGMYAWAQESGEDFDLAIAERQMCEAVDKLVSLAPPSEVGVVLNLGDLIHADNTQNKTLRSGHVLDVDTRWGRVLEVGATCMERVVTMALRKHTRVIVRNNIGNHDEHTSQAIALGLHLLFRNEPRVTIDRSPSHFWYHRHGSVLIGSTHGDLVKPDQLPQVMATDAADDWGKSQHRYWYIGHVHHRKVIESPGCVVESFRTLAAKDAWTSMMGYRAGRDISCIVHDRDHGEVARHTVGVSMLS